MHKLISPEVEAIETAVVDAAFIVHRELGPGLLESVYEVCLYDVLVEKRLACERQVPIPVRFRGKRLDAGFRVDLVAGNEVLVELKSVEAFTKLHEAQMLTYLRLADRRLGFLINFNVPMIKQGIRRFARS